MNTRYAIRLLAGFLRGLIMIAITLLVLLGLVCALIVAQGHRDEAQQVGAGQVGAAVVLGAAQWNGQPSPVLRARLDHALDLYRAGYAPRVLVTGGVGDGDDLSESAVAAAYLWEQGVPAPAILQEEEGRSSLESIRGSADLL